MAEWLDLLKERQPPRVSLGIGRIGRARDALGLSLGMPVITVAGTNGKGSCCAYLEAILSAAGYRTGCFYSPHLVEFSERIRIGGRPLAQSDTCALFAKVERIDALRDKEDERLTYFEFVALAAALGFAESGCDAVIFEVGLGGRLDAVNVFDADVAVITSVSIDHTRLLGADRESIGFEKAGILRAGSPAVCGDQSPPASVVRQAGKLAVALHVRSRDFHARIGECGWAYRGKKLRSALPAPAMPGLYQYANASCALCALEQLEDRLPVSQAAVRAGLLEARLGGRFEVIPGECPVVLDVAHNVAAAQKLADTLLDMGFFRRTIAVFGARTRKDVAGIVKALTGRIERWHIAPVGGDTGDGAAIAAVAAADAEDGLVIHPSVAQAAQAAHSEAGKGDRILVTGSFYTVAEYLKTARLRDSFRR